MSKAGVVHHKPSMKSVLLRGAFIIMALYIALYVVYVVQQPRALGAGAITSLINNTVPLALASAGQAIVVLSRGFDLSLAGVVSITNVVMAVYPLEGPGGALASLAICLAIGGVVGAVNGWLVAYLRIQAIAATLATMIVCQGVALLILDAPGGAVAEWVSYELTDRIFYFIPVSGLILGSVVCLWLLVRKTDFGIALYAIGADEHAARLSGIPVLKVRFFAFVLAGMIYGLAGYMLSAQTATGSPTAGEPLLMLSFAAVALGGTSLSGGKGGLFASVMGAATLMLLQKVLFSSGVSSFYTGIFQGAVLIFAVMFSALLTRLGERKSK
ncbi:ABC transporter permease [Rhizobium ruizarguesonis]|uniref:ABC transporter permease n=1 Tax=Rhizobium ruizarguesonis TaxID=2081791 RepID=A0AB38HY28_9HYPH|nr:ABC transporter permease [Rhizobium ruizarguesonis]NEJ18884.1 ABC transporter permease [Rhizobium leguminosarum]MBC2806744.1 ABC transporter permease [Rhizobium ruizarguesonis]NEI18905.1 ABC transporter permease [Rhizobium ruizarguesonis]NEJ02901.1 ABC transporter permease [Rhizobium ruizarguesonis]NEJ39957.1 ABC transporter permease [Rhizobium ruizarguesonis]